MSGGAPSITNSTATIRYGDSSQNPNLTLAERVAAKRREQAPTVQQPEDLADLALRDAASGRVRRIRAGSTRDSILGQAMQIGFLLCISVLYWLGLREP